MKGGSETLKHVDYVYCEVTVMRFMKTMLILKSWMSILPTMIWIELKLFSLVASGNALYNEKVMTISYNRLGSNGRLGNQMFQYAGREELLLIVVLIG